jgi:glutamine synthetase
MAKAPKSVSDAMKYLKENDVKYVDLRFTDPRGKMQHVTMDVSPGRRRHVCRRHHVRRLVDRRLEGDQRVRHGSDAGHRQPLHMDPFFAQPTMAIFCDILEPGTGEAYERDPRMTAKKAEAYVKSSGIGDTIMFGPEAEFFMFDDVRFRG